MGHITTEIDHALARQAAVALIGPRQAGKTTLAIGETCKALYLDLEDRDDRNRLTNPALFFENAEDRLVILDEIHRMPEIFETLRGVIDKRRRKNTGPTSSTASCQCWEATGEVAEGLYPSFDALAHPEMAVASAKQGCDLLLASEDWLSSQQRLQAGIRSIENICVAVCALNDTGIWLTPEGHNRWEELSAGSNEVCRYALDTNRTRTKSFQDRIDFEVLLR